MSSVRRLGTDRPRPGLVLLAAALLSLLGACSGPDEPSYVRDLEPGHVLDDEEVRALVEAVIEHYGGRELWSSLQFHMKHDVYLKHTGDPMSNRGTRTTFCRPDACFRQSLRQRSGDQERLLSHGEAWMSVSGQPLTKTTGDNHLSVWWEYKAARIVDLLGREGSRVEVLPAESVVLGGEGESGEELLLYPMKLVDGQRPEIQLWIDPRKLEIRRLESTIPLGPNVKARRVTLAVRQEYSSFVRHEGVLVPERVDAFSLGRKGNMEWIALVELRDRGFEIATSIDDAVFAAQ